MKNFEIQNIITKKLLGEASSEESLLLEKWRAESEENDTLYKEYSEIWNASANYKAVDFQSKTEAAYQKHLDLLTQEESKVVELQPKVDKNQNEAKVFKLFTMQRVASIAALFVIVFGAMFVFNSFNTTSFNAGNDVMFVSLEDGSSIWLDAGSTVSYDSGFGEYHRNINLDGRAFFDVKKNKDIEFAITSNDMNVSVLGTSFTVDTKADNNVVSVKTGKVAVTSGDKKVTLLPNEKVRLVDNSFINEVASPSDVSWRNEDLSFNNARLDQVIADINLFHDNKIVLDSDSKALDCPFTSKSLKKTSFENIIEILEITYDLQVEKNLEENNISLLISDCK